jgi:hypothetical protein
MQISFKNFFRILNAKGIENYDKAIEALEKPINSSQTPRYYELGKILGVKRI